MSLRDLLLLPLAREHAAQPHSLVGVGGGAAAAEVLAEALREAAGPWAKVCVVGAAGKDPPARAAKSAKLLRAAGFVPVVLDGAPARRLRHLETCAAVYFAGGSQVLLARALRGAEGESPLLRAIRDAAARGAVIAGTSAGAAVFGADMITTGVSHDSLSDGPRRARHMAGLGLLPGVVVDQHFVARGHLGRLIAFLRRHGHRIGIGIDEGAAVIFARDAWRVLGRSHAVLVEMGEGIEISLLAAGERHDPASGALHPAAGAAPVDLDGGGLALQTDAFGREALSDMLKRMVEARAARAMGLSLPPRGEAEDAVAGAWRLRFAATPRTRAWRTDTPDAAGWSVHRLALSIDAVDVRIAARGGW